MIDPVTAIAGATAAFNAIKSGFSVGREIESMAGDLGRWMNCISDLKRAEEQNKKPPLFRKLFQASSVEEEAMSIFMAKKKAEDIKKQFYDLEIIDWGQITDVDVVINATSLWLNNEFINLDFSNCGDKKLSLEAENLLQYLKLRGIKF